VRPPEAVCHRCGGPKKGPFVPCKACEFEPRGEERSVAWLFSRAWLSEEDLPQAAQRIQQGHQPDVSRELREMARVEMGAVPIASGALRPLRVGQLLSLSAANLIITPLTGLAVWYGLRDTRPVAARQAALVTAPVFVGMTLLWSSIILKQILA
jgi:hypothetical protein